MVQEEKQDQQSKQTIEVEWNGEKKEYSVDDVKNILEMRKSSTENYQKASPILKAAEKYGISPEELLEQSEYALETVHQLIQDGFIDSEGNKIKEIKKEQEVDDIFSQKKPISEEDIVNKALKRVEEVVSKSLSPLAERTSKVERVIIADKIQSRHPELTPKDMAEVFARSERDKNKTILEHSDDVSSESTSYRELLKKEFAKELGVDIDEINKRQEQSPEGGASHIISGRKVRFKNTKKKWGNKEDDPNVVSPKEAMKEFFNNQ